MGTFMRQRAMVDSADIACSDLARREGERESSMVVRYSLGDSSIEANAREEDFRSIKYRSGNNARRETRSSRYGTHRQSMALVVCDRFSTKA